MIRRRCEPMWRTAVKRGLRAAGLFMPLPLQLRLVHRRPALTWLIRPGQRVVFEQYLGEFAIEAHTNSQIERHMLSGVYEPHLLRVLDRLVNQGDVCLDIGANVGAMTFALAQRCGADGRVYSFEPAPILFERLQRNIALNRTCESVVHAFNVGLAEQPGELHWAQSTAGEGNGRLLDAPSTRSVPVPVTSLDDWTQQHGIQRVDSIKIDVERMEWAVVRGGLRTIETHRPRILFETLPCYGQPVLESLQRELCTLLRDINYTLHGVGQHGLVDFTDLPPTYETLALPTSRQSR